MKCIFAVLAAIAILNVMVVAQEVQPDEEITYKTIGDTVLKLHMFKPEKHKVTDERPCIVFFFGGGWNSGDPDQFYPHCLYLASRGMVAVSAEYRVKNRHGTPPYACVQDGKSAVRWLRTHADELGIDPQRIAAGGGSAGGHVAAATGTVDGFEEAGEDLRIASAPNALLLFNPVYDNGPHGYGYDRVKEQWEAFSPLHNIDTTTPPAIVFLGTEDTLIPVSTAKEFRRRMKQSGPRSKLKLYKDQPHGFFNYRDGKNTYYFRTVYAADRFLAKLDYLDGKPTLRKK
jgi:acetyl esterase/lipase